MILHIIFLIATGIAFAGQFTDSYTTTLGIRIGAVEANASWLTKYQWLMYSLKSMYALVFLIMTLFLGYNSAVLAGCIAALGGVAAWGFYSGVQSLAVIKIQEQYNAQAAAAAAAAVNITKS